MESDGITQADVAAELGASQSTVARWLAGGGIRSTHRDRLAAYLERKGLGPVVADLTAEHVIGAGAPVYSPETRIARAADRLGNGLEPVAAQIRAALDEGVAAGPAAMEATGALDKLLDRLAEFVGAVEQVRDELVKP